MRLNIDLKLKFFFIVVIMIIDMICFFKVPFCIPLYLRIFKSMEALREKLQIKSEALNMLGKQLEMCNKEKIEYKKMIDTLYDKNLSLKKMLYVQQNHVDAEDENNLLYASGSLFSGTTSPNTNTATVKQANSKSRNQKLSHKNQYLTSVDTRSIPSLFNDIDSDVCFLFV